MESHDSTSEPPNQPHLGESINIATRALHAKLNKQILQYLPLALPPHANNPSVYLAGMLQIAPIYLTLESCWEDILTTYEDQLTYTTTTTATKTTSPPRLPLPTPPPKPSPTPSPEKVTTQSSVLLEKLRALHNPLLSRTTPLLSDLRALAATFWSNGTPPAEEKLALLEPQAVPPPSPSVLGAWLARMQQSLTMSTATATTAATATGMGRGLGLGVDVGAARPPAQSRPHLLLAYAWVLYMALFAGGRMVRGVLEGVGGEFWVGRLDGSLRDMHVDGGDDSKEEKKDGDEDHLAGGAEAGNRGDGDAKQTMPLAFFGFETPRDGENLKQEFKRGFEEAGKVLTAQERGEVVDEAKRIFEHLTSLVASLHETLGKDSDDPGSGTGSGIVSRWVDWVTARAGRGSEVKKRGPLVKIGRAKKVVRFEEAALQGRAGEQAAQGLTLGLGAWSLVLGLVIIGSALALTYAWR